MIIRLLQNLYSVRRLFLMSTNKYIKERLLYNTNCIINYNNDDNYFYHRLQQKFFNAFQGAEVAKTTRGESIEKFEESA